MPLRNITNKVLKAWYEVLNGNVTVSGYTFPVYRTGVPAEEESHHIIVRLESETPKPNNQTWVTSPVIITEIVTKFAAIVDDGLAAEVDDIIAQLLYPSTPGHIGLPPQGGIQIVEVVRQNATTLPEDDGTFKYHRLITRNLHRVLQDAGIAEPGIGTFIVS